MQSGDQKLPTTLETWEALIVSVLAVYQYSISRVLSCLDELRGSGVTNVGVLGSYDLQSLVNKLRGAGYDRGKLTALYADRLISLGRYFQECDREALETVLVRGSRDELLLVLGRIPGVGPKVVDNFLTLRAQNDQRRAP